MPLCACLSFVCCLGGRVWGFRTCFGKVGGFRLQWVFVLRGLGFRVPGFSIYGLGGCFTGSPGSVLRPGTGQRYRF